jgi:hypothetical protein
VVRARGNSVNDGRGWGGRRSHSGNADLDLLFLAELQFQDSKLQRLARPQHGLPHRLPVDQGSIGGSEIVDPNSPVLESDLAMEARNRWVAQAQFIRGIAPRPVDPGLQLIMEEGLRTREYEFRRHDCPWGGPSGSPQTIRIQRMEQAFRTRFLFRGTFREWRETAVGSFEHETLDGSGRQM